jgi:hypothetical protein
MNLDKEALAKNRFWILLGVFVPLWLFVVILLGGSVAGTISEARKKYEDAKKELDQQKDVKNDNFIKPLQEKEEALKQKKEEVWAAAWKGQDGLMTWPGNPQAPLHETLQKAYFGDDMPYGHRLEFGDNLYLTQFDGLAQVVTPAYFLDGFEKVMQPVQTWKTHTLEDCWLSQEDFWVKRELLSILQEATSSVARFQRVELTDKEKSENLPAGVVGRQRFRNPNYELDILLERKGGKLVLSDKSKVKNVNVTGRLFALNGVPFRVWQRDPNDPKTPRAEVTWVIEGEPLPAGATTEAKKEVRIDTFDEKTPLEVEQVFTWSWSTAPIKRIDRIAVGTPEALSHRNANRSLKPRPFKKDKDEKEPEATSPAGGPPGVAGGPVAGGPVAGGPVGGGAGGLTPPGMGSGGPGGMGGNNAVSKTLTPNGIERNRYVDLSEQVRRLPVAVVLVVDQAAIPEVLTAFANSRLRMWTTQWQWRHVRGIPSPVATPSGGEAAPAEGGGATTGATTGARPPMVGSGMPPRAGSGMPPRTTGPGKPMGGTTGHNPYGPYGMPPPGVGGGQQAQAADEDDPNLVELTVYNIASLYERYPPRKQEETPPGGLPPGPGVAPPGGTPPGPGVVPPAPPAGAPVPPPGAPPKP